MTGTHITALFVGGPRDGESTRVSPALDVIHVAQLKTSTTSCDIRIIHDQVEVERIVYVRRLVGTPKGFPVAVFTPHDMPTTELMALLINNYAPRGKK